MWQMHFRAWVFWTPRSRPVHSWRLAVLVNPLPGFSSTPCILWHTTVSNLPDRVDLCSTKLPLEARALAT